MSVVKACGVEAQRTEGNILSQTELSGTTKGTFVRQQEILIDRPGQGQCVEVITEIAQTYILNFIFNPSDTRVQVEGNNLVLVFGGRSRIVFKNFVSTLQLEHGLSLHYRGENLIPLLIAEGVIPDVHKGMPVFQPGIGQEIVIISEPKQRYILKFNPTQARVQIKHDDLIFKFPVLRGRIVFKGLGKFSGRQTAPIFETAEAKVASTTLMSQVNALIENKISMETSSTVEIESAREESQENGSMSYCNGMSQPFASRNSQGVIPPFSIWGWRRVSITRARAGK